MSCTWASYSKNRPLTVTTLSMCSMRVSRFARGAVGGESARLCRSQSTAARGGGQDRNGHIALLAGQKSEVRIRFRMGVFSCICLRYSIQNTAQFSLNACSRGSLPSRISLGLLGVCCGLLAYWRRRGVCVRWACGLHYVWLILPAGRPH